MGVDKLGVVGRGEEIKAMHVWARCVAGRREMGGGWFASRQSLLVDVALFWLEWVVGGG